MSLSPNRNSKRGGIPPPPPPSITNTVNQCRAQSVLVVFFNPFLHFFLIYYTGYYKE